MPLVPHSSYTAPTWLPGGHVQTIFPALFRQVPQIDFIREWLPTPDGDRIAIDLFQAGKQRGSVGVILSHGLEGHSRRKYMRGMCNIFASKGWDSLARNFRGCGGEINLTPGLYHSGQTEDLHTAVKYALELGYQRILLVGFSMGGNQVLKYLGEAPERVPAQVAGAVVFSVTCDLSGAASVLDQPQNAIYMYYFLYNLRQKVRLKHARFPAFYPLEGLNAIRTFAEFDERYTAPVHGFASAGDYWEKTACLPHLQRIAIPALLVNARNDPFLSEGCYPAHIAASSDHLFLEMPEDGGHVGFTSLPRQEFYWSEFRAVEFFNNFVLDAPK